MLFRLIYDDVLAQGAYLIGCQRSGQAIVVDPSRDVDRYLAEAARHGLRLVAAAETHIHADFLSGVRELAEVHGLRAYLSGEGGADWSYAWPRDGLDVRILRDGDRFEVGGIAFRALHTPGHTPEHLAYEVTDRGSGAIAPMGILTGDFVFVGDLGRPDLLETAAGVAGAKEASARDLHRSARGFLEHADHLQVWPAHGAGSACGKALGAVPQSTVGYERVANPALRLAHDASAFVDYVLEGQPEPPLYFARMKVENRDGAALLRDLPRPAELPDAAAAIAAREAGATIVDTRGWNAFRAGHLPGALWAPLDGQFHGVVGSYVEPEQDVVLVVEPADAERAARAMVRIGLDRLVGTLDPLRLSDEGAPLATVPEWDVARVHRELADGAGGAVLDVRRAVELTAGSLRADALQAAHTRLPAHLDAVPRDRRLFVHCGVGRRSAYAVAFLRSRGYDAINVEGGLAAWARAGLPVVGR